MGQPTNALLQRLGRAQLWPRHAGVTSRSLAYADQQFKSQLASKLIGLLFTYGIITPTLHPWAIWFRRVRPYRPNYAIQIPAVRGKYEYDYNYKSLYYGNGVWYEGRYVYWNNIKRRKCKYVGLHWGNVRVLNLGSNQLFLLRGLTTTFAIGAETDNPPIWGNVSPLTDSNEADSGSLAAWSRAMINNNTLARLQNDVTLSLLATQEQQLDSRSWL